MKLIYVKKANSKGYLKLGLAGEEKEISFVVREEDYSEAGSPSVGENLARDTVSLFQNADMRYKAQLKAMRILAYGDNSERMLFRKLKLAGFDDGLASEVVSEMRTLGYINTERQLSRLISAEVNLHNLGRGKILPKLISKGYTRSDIDTVMSSLIESGEIDFSLARERLIKAKLPDGASEEEIKKLLFKNGHSIC